MEKEAKFYAVGNKEYLSASDPEEAVNNYIEEAWGDESPADLPEFVMVDGYDPLKIDAYFRGFEWCIDTLIESLDENFGPFDDPSDYKLSEKSKELFEAFKKQVCDEYPVWQCEKVGEPKKVYLAPLLEGNTK